MKKVIIPATILCTVICIGLHIQPNEDAEPAPEPAPTQLQVEVTTAQVPGNEGPIVEVTMPTLVPVPPPVQTSASTPTPMPIPTPTQAPMTAPAATQPVQAGDLVYVPGFGWLESQGEGTVIYDKLMYENGNKVGSMD